MTEKHTVPRAIISFIGSCLIIIEMIIIGICSWHPWPEHGISIVEDGDGSLNWADGSRLGCAEMYKNYPAAYWHLDIYYGRSNIAHIKSMDFATEQEAVTEANKHCQP